MPRRLLPFRTRRSLLVTGVVVALAGSGSAIAGVTASGAATPELFRITPTAFAFGYVPVGSRTAEQKVIITNISGVPQMMSGSGGGAGVYGGSQNCQGSTLAPNHTCAMFYAFSPTSTGSQPGSTNGSWNGQSFSLTFTGFGTPQFRITPTALDFGTVKVGKTSPQQIITVTNLANQPVVMSGSGGGAGVFGGAQSCQGQTLAAGKSCKMFYAFTPAKSGVTNGSTSGTWNGQSFTLHFTGIGD